MAGNNDDFDSWVDDYVKERDKGTSAPKGPPPGSQIIDSRTKAPSMEARQPVPQASRSAPRSLPKIPDVRPKAVPDSDFEYDTLNFGPWDTGVQLPAAFAKGLAQLGSGMADWDEGSKQLMHDITGGRAYKDYTRANADEKRKRDDPLNRGFAGTLNNFAGKVLPSMTLPMSLGAQYLGRAAPLATAPITGAVEGAVEPVATGESRGANMLLGAAGNMAVPYTKYGLASLAGDFNPRLNQLANEAARRGFKFGIADTSDQDSLVRSVRRLGEYFPGGRQYLKYRRNYNDSNFNKQIADTIGADDLTQEAFNQRRNTLDSSIRDMWTSRPPTELSPQMRSEIWAARQRANRSTPEVAEAVNRQLDNLMLRQAVPEIDPVTRRPTGRRHISGESGFNLQKQWEQDYGTGDGQVNEIMRDVRRSLVNNFNQNLPPDQRSVIQGYGRQYKAAKAIEGAVNDSEAGKSQKIPGYITPQQLSNSVSKAYPGNVEGSPFGPLTQMGQQMGRDTSTRNRDVVANYPIAGGVTSGVVTSGLLANPTLAGAVAGPAAVAAGLGAGIPGMLSSPVVRQLAVGQIPDIGYGVRSLGDLGKKTASRAVRATAAQAPLAWYERSQANEELGQLPYEEEEMNFIQKYLAQ